MYEKKRRKEGGHFRRCCEYIKTRQGIMTECGKRANYRKSWGFYPYCGLPIAVLFNYDDCKS